VLYDCRRYADYKGMHARFVPQAAEEWVVSRTLAEETVHFIHLPSLPFGFSSGKLGDWYPDTLDASSGKLVMWKTKAGYQPGWFAQHQRLVKAISSQKRRAPVIVQGDFHASGAGRVSRSGELRLDAPIDIVMSGTLGTGDMAFPSAFRAVQSAPSQMVDMQV